MSASPEAAGTIYDIGYRHYDGPRLGRRGAIGAVIGSGLRAAFGFGRSGRSKIIPWGAVLFGAMPAVVAIAVEVLTGAPIELYSYDSYLWSIGALLPIFIAAQAPELVVNDIRHHVLPLYFSRPISRLDYVSAKLVALALALLTLTLLPVLLLFVGRILAADDVVAAVGDEWDALPAIFGSGVMHAAVLALVGLAICSLAARRAYAAGAVLAVFLIGGAISEGFAATSGALQDVGPFVSPLAILDGAREWLFGGSTPDSPVSSADVALPLYGLAVVILALGAAAVLFVRYRRISA